MSEFEFLFTLFGLVLGLSIAEVLGGFGKAVKARARLRIGWLTPLLGVLVMLDLTSFWTIAWSMRQTIPLNYLMLMLMLGFTAIYYVAASLVFPEEPDRCRDFDDNYWANKRLVLGAMFVLNAPTYALDWVWLRERSSSITFTTALTTCFLILLVAAMFAKGARLNLLLLGVIIALYPLGAYGGLASW
jgi:hypothetical protein